MEILQLKYFAAAARYEHMTKAANKLHIAQPALTQSIKRLENELGVTLFNRVGRNIVLSPEGKVLEAHVIPILRSIEKLPEIVGNTADITSRTITVIVLSASELLTDLVIEYQSLHPEAIFQIKQQDNIHDWDIRISSLTTPSSSRSKEVALTEEIFMAVPWSSKYANRDNIQLKEIAEESFICLDDSRPFTKICDDYCIKAGFEPKAAYESDSPATARKLIEAGLGVSFWPKYSWGPQNSSKIKLLPITFPKCTRQIYISKNPSSTSYLQKDFYKFLEYKFKEL